MKMSSVNQKAFKKVTDDFLDSIREEISSCLILGDMDRFGRLVTIVHIHLDSELLNALKNNGLSKDIEALADKAGRITNIQLKGET
jgi:hypothetical protein